jgi:hypothetical protein
MLMKSVCFCLLQYSKDKGYFDDITEGKFSFPIIHAIKSRPDDNQVLRILLSQMSFLAENSKSVTGGYFEFLQFFCSRQIIKMGINHFADKYKPWAIHIE